MTRRYYGSHWTARDWAIWHEGRRNYVTAAFFGLDYEVRAIFFALSTNQLDQVLSAYGVGYGSSARAYAAKTYPKWKVGRVNPSAETLQRLLQQVPAVLPLQDRARLLALVRARSRRVTTQSLCCLATEAGPVVSSVLAEQLAVGLRHETPAHVREALAWLSCESMKAAETILRLGETIEAQRLAGFARREVERLESAIVRSNTAASDLRRRFSHRVDTPYAKLNVTVLPELPKPSFFSTPPKVTRMSDITPRKPDDLLGELTKQLSDTERTDLRRLAAREQLSLDVKAREAALQHSASGAEIDRTLDAAERLQYGEKTSGFTVSGSHRGASGTTNIEVRRGEPTATMLKWLAIGGIIVVAFFMCAK